MYTDDCIFFIKLLKHITNIQLIIILCLPHVIFIVMIIKSFITTIKLLIDIFIICHNVDYITYLIEIVSTKLDFLL